ncbi:hypothetical protein FFLO_06519 [Filobasidium floriforme]|uniref:Uncharacterized protein n=1 Tax=Filobasidium floriforme TaxID=5210 RepID=A0A8K0JF80_9TREE|nr:uncharacterized protein HD553DRAFT_323519 [Filobasidium floriforme]KAG7527894.1 hypothetical protein FFLO_06519 [Filobasidium floriforme]KAH8085660.1 hypothetical protein HD553DRAFT_323519 [Filobasidium floriforme]
MPPEDCNPSRASSVTVIGDPVDDSDTSSVTAQETSPSASEDSVTVGGDSPSVSSNEEHDQTQVDTSSRSPSLKRKRRQGGGQLDTENQGVQSKKNAVKKKIIRSSSPGSEAAKYLYDLCNKQRADLEKRNRERLAVLRREQNLSETERVFLLVPSLRVKHKRSEKALDGIGGISISRTARSQRGLQNYNADQWWCQTNDRTNTRGTWGAVVHRFESIGSRDNTSNEQESADLPWMEESLDVPWQYLVNLGLRTHEVGLLAADLPAAVTTNG